MKLISLNAWGASQGKIFFDFVKFHKKNTDIFCFQEVLCSLKGSPISSHKARSYMFWELEKLLPEFTGFFEAKKSYYDLYYPVKFPLQTGMAIFVKKNLELQSYFTSIMLERGSYTDNPAEYNFIAQTILLKKNKRNISIINFHGISRPGEKLDTQKRITQSKNLQKLWDSIKCPKILCGDFNLEINTKSIKILEKCGVNLIKRFEIKNTRNEITWKKYKNKQHFADYCFVSKTLKVNDFKVPYNLVSDHLPMILDFEF